MVPKFMSNMEININRKTHELRYPLRKPDIPRTYKTCKHYILGLAFLIQMTFMEININRKTHELRYPLREPDIPKTYKTCKHYILGLAFLIQMTVSRC